MVQQLRDLDAGLFAINKLEVAYMNARVAEIQAIINRANAAANTTTSGMATGGYAWLGKYTLGEQGREYVLTNRTTQAAEAIVGGSLTQDRLLGAIARGGPTVNYSGRFSGEYTAGMRRQVNADVQRAIGQALSGV
jgi:hypothetical protein